MWTKKVSINCKALYFSLQHWCVIEHGFLVGHTFYLLLLFFLRVRSDWLVIFYVPFTPVLTLTRFGGRKTDTKCLIKSSRGQSCYNWLGIVTQLVGAPPFYDISWGYSLVSWRLHNYSETGHALSKPETSRVKQILSEWPSRFENCCPFVDVAKSAWFSKRVWSTEPIKQT